MNNIRIHHINKKNVSSIFELECTHHSPNLRIFMNSLSKTGLIVGSSSNETFTTLRFKANSVKSFQIYKTEMEQQTKRQGLSIHIIAKMVDNLMSQLNYLLYEEHMPIIGYHSSDILVINDDTFVFINYENMVKTNQHNQHNQHNKGIFNEFFTITMPFDHNDFFVSPEQMRIKELPAKIHYHSCYFSVALFIVYALLGNDEFYQDYVIHQNPQAIINCLDTHVIKDTKMYWLLSRCLAEDPNERCVLFV
jgi:hypothetical protein